MSAPALVIGEWISRMASGAAEIEQIVVAAHLAVPGVEARAAIALLVELHLLDHRAHGAVEHQDALGGELSEQISGAGVGRAGHVHSCFLQPPGRRPNRWQTA